MAAGGPFNPSVEEISKRRRRSSQVVREQLVCDKVARRTVALKSVGLV